MTRSSRAARKIGRETIHFGVRTLATGVFMLAIGWIPAVVSAEEDSGAEPGNRSTVRRERIATDSKGATRRHRLTERSFENGYSAQWERQGQWLDDGNQRQRGRARVHDADGNLVGQGRARHREKDGKIRSGREYRKRNEDGSVVRNQQRKGKQNGSEWQQQRRAKKRRDGSVVKQRRERRRQQR